MKKLLAKYRDQLAQLDVSLQPDNPRLDPNLLKLAVLDQKRRSEGLQGVFSTARRKQRLTKTNGYASAVDSTISGLYTLRIRAAGTTRKGFRYSRETRFNVVSGE